MRDDFPPPPPQTGNYQSEYRDSPSKQVHTWLYSFFWLVGLSHFNFKINQLKIKIWFQNRIITSFIWSVWLKFLAFYIFLCYLMYKTMWLAYFLSPAFANERGHKIAFVCRLSVCPSVPLSVGHKNFNLSHNFWTIGDLAFIVHMHIPYEEDLSIHTKMFFLVTLSSQMFQKQNALLGIKDSLHKFYFLKQHTMRNR